MWPIRAVRDATQFRKASCGSTCRLVSEAALAFMRCNKAKDLSPALVMIYMLFLCITPRTRYCQNTLQIVLVQRVGIVLLKCDQDILVLAFLP